MEKLCMRFPLASEMILNNLDNQSLIRSKEACRAAADIIKNKRFYLIRIIKKYRRSFEEHEESWREVCHKIPLDNLRQLAVAVKVFAVYFNYKSLQCAGGYFYLFVLKCINYLFCQETMEDDA